MTGRGMSERIEIVMRRERRRSFSVEEKLRIVDEMREPGATVAEVARRHGLGTNLLYVWRRMAEGRGARPAEPVRLIPVQIEGPAPSPASAAPSGGGGRIEIGLPGGIKVKIDGEVAPDRLAAVLALLRRR